MINIWIKWWKCYYFLLLFSVNITFLQNSFPEILWLFLQNSTTFFSKYCNFFFLTKYYFFSHKILLFSLNIVTFFSEILWLFRWNMQNITPFFPEIPLESNPTNITMCWRLTASLCEENKNGMLIWKGYEWILIIGCSPEQQRCDIYVILIINTCHQFKNKSGGFWWRRRLGSGSRVWERQEVRGQRSRGPMSRTSFNLIRHRRTDLDLSCRVSRSRRLLPLLLQTGDCSL